jgi:type II secretory pathway component GspD/PulD (secretin)
VGNRRFFGSRPAFRALGLALAFALPSGASATVPQPQTAVFSLTQIPASQAARLLRGLYPHARVTLDAGANSIIVSAPENDLTAIKSVLAGIDVRNPIAPASQAFALRTVKAGQIARRIQALFPAARLQAAPGDHTLLVQAPPADMTQISAIVASIDTPAPSAQLVPRAPRTTEAFRVNQTSAHSLGRAIATTIGDVRVDVNGDSILITGPPDEVARAKTLAEQLDQPPAGVRFTSLYRIHYYDAASVGDFLARSFRGIAVDVDKGLNAITVFGTASEQQRVAAALEQVDTQNSSGQGLPVAQPGGATGPIGGPNGSFEVYTLKAAVPGLAGAPSSSANDIAQSVTQALQSQAADLRITVVPSTNQLILTGSVYSLELARQLIDQLDVAQKLVVLDTQVLEIDATYAQDLGLSFSNPQVISTTYSEATPPPDANGNPQRLLGLGPLTRTPLSLGLQLSLAIQQGKGRVLENPRIATISGRTASIRAGDTISVATTAGGGAGTVATTQLQTFQTGVTLDITPIVNAGDFITILVHPTVNSETGLLNGIPQISTRDTQTTVELRENETLVIGGLIEDNATHTTNKIPLLGDLPLIGELFRENIISNSHDELVITVTPHVITPGAGDDWPQRGLPVIPTPAPLRTLAANFSLPHGDGPLHRSRSSASPAAVVSPVTAPPATPAPATLPPPSGPTPASHGGATSTPGQAAGTAATVRGDALVYGALPASNVAAPTDPVKIFYADLSPVALSPGKNVTVNATTTTNAVRVTLVNGLLNLALSQTAAGTWRGYFPLPAALGSGPTSLLLTAYRSDGTNTSLALPVTVTP